MSFAANVSISATVNRTAVKLGGTFTFSVTVTTGVTRALPEPVLEQTDDFEIRGKSTSSSSSVSIVNGKLTSEKTIRHSYSLVPTKAGDLVIPPAVLTYKGKKFSTDPINVRVIQRGMTRKNTDPVRKQSRGKGTPEIFIHTVVNKDTAYTEEAVIVEYFLYSRLNISDLTGIDLPGSSGFWWEEETAFAGGSGKQEVLKGNVYVVYPLKRFVVYPLSSGEKTIEPLGIGCRIRVRSRDIFDSFSIFGRDKTITVLSEEISLTVLPLPEKGKPDDFNGAVGDFTIRTEIDKNTVNQNEPLTLKVTIEGKGNFRTMGQPTLTVPDGVSLYPPDESEEVRFIGDNFSGRKFYEYIIIPREEGIFEIGDIRFSSFNPAAAAYVLKDTGKIAITVEGQSLAGQGLVGGNSESMVLGEDLHYIKNLSGELTIGDTSTAGGHFLLAANALSVLLVLGFFLKLKRTEKIRSSKALRRQRYAGKNLKRSFGEAKKLLDEADHHLLTQKCEKSVLDFLGDRLDEETTGMTFKELKALLEANAIEEKTINLFTEWHESCQLARFSPEEVDTAWRKDLLKTTEMLAAELGERLP